MDDYLVFFVFMSLPVSQMYSVCSSNKGSSSAKISLNTKPVKVVQVRRTVLNRQTGNKKN